MPGIIASVIAMFMFIFVYDAPASIIEKEGDLKKVFLNQISRINHLNFQARKSLATYYGVEEDDPCLDEEMAICEKRLQKKVRAVSTLKKTFIYNVLQAIHK